jgi:hypothetical protein
MAPFSTKGLLGLHVLAGPSRGGYLPGDHVTAMLQVNARVLLLATGLGLLLLSQGRAHVKHEDQFTALFHFCQVYCGSSSAVLVQSLVVYATGTERVDSQWVRRLHRVEVPAEAHEQRVRTELSC